MRMPLLRGRSLGRDDIDRRESNVVVNKALAQAYFPGQDPIGRRIRSSRMGDSTLADDRGRRGKHADVAPGERAPIAQLFMPMSIAGGPDIPREALIGPDVTIMNYVVRSSLPSSSLVTAVRRAHRQRRSEPRHLASAFAPGHRRSCVGSDVVHDGPAGHSSHGGAPARRDRHLRRDLVHRRAAHRRDWRPARDGRRAAQRGAHDLATGRTGDAARHRRWD